MKCEYEVKEKPNGRRVTVNCMECLEDFDLKKCHHHIVEMMSREYNIDHIIFSDHMETLIKGDAVQIYSHLGSLSKELKHLALRKTVEKKCEVCPVTPKKIFTGLDTSLRDDPASLFKTYKRLSYELMKSKGCNECRKGTKEDLERMGDQVMDMVKLVNYKAFGIVE